MTHKGTVPLENERLILRRFKMNDAEAVFKNWAGDTEVTYFLRWPAHTEISTTKGFLTREIERYSNDNCYSWGIELKFDKTLIGTIGVVGIRDDLGLIQIGYCIGRAWWHKGYTSEALKQLILFFFEEVRVNRIEANHDPRNPNSGKVMLKAGLKYEGTLRGADYNNQGICDASYYAILAEDYFNRNDNQTHKTTSNIETIKRLTDLMFVNLRIAMDTVDWNTDVCGAPAWRYIYHTLHSADKYFINTAQYDEPPFHVPKLDWPDTPSEIILSRETLYEYYEQVRQKILDFLDGLTENQLIECPNGKLSRLGLVLSQLRHMYAHIGILNGITIARTSKYPRVLNESRKHPEGLYDEDVR